MKNYILKHLGMFAFILIIMFVGFWLRSLLHAESLLVDWQIKTWLTVIYAVGIPLILLISDYRENLVVANSISTKVWLVYRARYDLGWRTSKIEFFEEDFERYLNREFELIRLRQLHKTEQ